MGQLLSGLVVSQQSGFFNVETPEGIIYTCRIRGRLLETAQSADVVAIGDHVQIEVSQDDEDHVGTIAAVAERTSVLSRAVRTTGNRGAGAAEREHIIIANAEQAFFVFAVAQPKPDNALLDRFLVVGERAEIEHLIIVANKIDLETPDNIQKRFAPYEDAGYLVLHTSALMGAGVDELREHLRGKVSVFTGPSGVGKTSLLNHIQPDLGRSVKAVGYSQEGVHTTRDSALVRLENGGYIADTPGIRNLNLYDIEPEELDAYYVEIAPLVSQCRFSNCTHTNEPGCAVRAAAKANVISPRRYKSYLSLREELEAAIAVY